MTLDITRDKKRGQVDLSPFSIPVLQPLTFEAVSGPPDRLYVESISLNLANDSKSQIAIRFHWVERSAKAASAVSGFQ